MSFLIRAALVIGVLSWMALQRQGTPAPDVRGPALADAALAAWETLPEAARAAALQEGRAEIGRRVGTLAAQSRDTLVASDRKVPWQGAQTRAHPDRVAERRER